MPSRKPLSICIVASEAVPFAKTGGLADVSSALTRGLVAAGHDARLVMPLYGRLLDAGIEIEPIEGVEDRGVELGSRSIRVGFRRTRLPDSEAEVLLVDAPELFGGPEIYGAGAREALRFGLLSAAPMLLCQALGWRPDVFHCNDWHTGLLPLYLKYQFSWDALFERTKTLLTIHNIGYQGAFEAGVLEELGLTDARDLFYREDLEAGAINFLKTGLLYADGLSTVSPTYARETQEAEYGMGLEGILRARSSDYVGILNGIDAKIWSPEHDDQIPARFSAKDLSGKATCKRELLEGMGLEYGADRLLIGVVSRLTGQKGFELLPEVLPFLLRETDAQLIVLGSGEEGHEQFFDRAAHEHPDRIAFYRGYNERLAHWIEAGSDVFLMPSRYEPCGLNQMYSLAYGTLPLVRYTGGLADTVRDVMSGADANGFVFEAFDAQALLDALRRVAATWRDRDTWSRLVSNAMACDFTWESQVERYVELYASLAAS